MRVALVHDWLTGMRGGEKVLEVLCELFPDADLFTLLHVPGSCSETIERMRIRTSFVQRLPLAQTRYRTYLPVFPHAIESFQLVGHDLVVSSSHCVAKGVIPPAGAQHVSYVHTPMRYVWDQFGDYFGPGRAALPVRLAAHLVAPRLRAWDVTSAARVDLFVANSQTVAARIERRYRRFAEVIHPPVDAARFRVLPDVRPGDAYLMVTALAPYKRVDRAIEAFRRLGRRLVVVGVGQDERRLRAAAAPNIEFVGWLSSDDLAARYASARAVVFPGEEDFGIVPLEAQACGRPVIAYGRGGVTESVVPLGSPRGTPTGVFFNDPTADALAEAVLRFERSADAFDPDALRANALRFDRPIFKERLREFLAAAVAAGPRAAGARREVAVRPSASA